jgi:LDH2 family malate/lactate/ureidoglycolate dehydrogenase
MNQRRFAFSQINAFIEQALLSLRFPEHDAHLIAQLMTQAEFQGSDGHGIIRLAPYTKRILSGGINLNPNIRIVKEKIATALIDGDNAMGHLVMHRATQLAIEKAKNTGIAWVGSQLSNHAGPASLYAKMALEHDMIGLYFAVGNANHLPPWGGLDMLLSTNPIAAAIPALEEPPIVLDMATTVAAYGKVKAKAQKGEMMPEGWMIDKEGRPLLDPNRSDEGFLLPIGGYKGYGLSLVVGILAGSLNGAAMGRQVIDFNKDYKTTTNTGQAIAIIDPNAFGEVEDFKRSIDQLIRDIKNSQRMPNVDKIWLPGEQSHEKKAHFMAHGVELSAPLIEQLNQLAVQLHIKPLSSN